MIDIDKEKLLRVLSNALDNANVLLDEHNSRFGITTAKNKFTAEAYDLEIKEINELILDL